MTKYYGVYWTRCTRNVILNNSSSSSSFILLTTYKKIFEHENFLYVMSKINDDDDDELFKITLRVYRRVPCDLCLELETLNNRLRNTNLDLRCFETPNSVLHNTIPSVTSVSKHSIKGSITPA